VPGIVAILEAGVLEKIGVPATAAAGEQEDGQEY